jgi:hypothetical protein
MVISIFVFITYRKNSTARRRAIGSIGILRDDRIITIVTIDALGTDGIAKADIVVRKLKYAKRTNLFMYKYCFDGFADERKKVERVINISIYSIK